MCVHAKALEFEAAVECKRMIFALKHIKDVSLINEEVRTHSQKTSGARSKPGMESPIIQSGESETWAPAGAAFWKGNLFFAGLRGQALYEYHLGQTQTKPVSHLREYGRLRAVTLGPDNMLYVTTSNTDGRGKPGAGDDKLLRIDPRGLR